MLVHVVIWPKRLLRRKAPTSKTRLEYLHYHHVDDSPQGTTQVQLSAYGTTWWEMGSTWTRHYQKSIHYSPRSNNLFSDVTYWSNSSCWQGPTWIEVFGRFSHCTWSELCKRRCSAFCVVVVVCFCWSAINLHYGKQTKRESLVQSWVEWIVKKDDTSVLY